MTKSMKVKFILEWTRLGVVALCVCVLVVTGAMDLSGCRLVRFNSLYCPSYHPSCYFDFSQPSQARLLAWYSSWTW